MSWIKRAHKQQAVTPSVPDMHIRNRYHHHFYETTGGYDPEQDGSDQRWGRIMIRCTRCGEERRVGYSLAEMQGRGGCTRKGGLPWQVGDLVIIKTDLYFDGQLVTEVEGFDSEGNILTYSPGRPRYHCTSKPEDVRPYNGKW